MIDGDMVRMYQDERRQLESEITQLKLALEGTLALTPAQHTLQYLILSLLHYLCSYHPILLT